MLLYNASHRHDAVTNRQPSCRRRVLEWLNASHTGSEARVCGLAIELAVFRCGIVPSPPTPGKAGRDTGCIAPRTFACVPESVLALPPAMAGFDRLRNRGSGPFLVSPCGTACRGRGLPASGPAAGSRKPAPAPRSTRPPEHRRPPAHSRSCRRSGTAPDAPRQDGGRKRRR